LAIGTVHVCHAQTLYGSVVGNVRDASQAVVVGAVVRLTNTETQQSRESLTNDVGGYNFATVPPGTYDLNIRKEGFPPSTQKGIAVTANNTLRLDATLTVGSVTESVTVGAAASPLQTDRAEVASNVGSNQLENLPMSMGRNYQTLFVTLP